MRRVPTNPRHWTVTPRSRRSLSRNLRSFLLFALGSLGTFLMAARVVAWLDGPSWLALVFLGVGLALAAYYLFRIFTPRR